MPVNAHQWLWLVHHLIVYGHDYRIALGSLNQRSRELIVDQDYVTGVACNLPHTPSDIEDIFFDSGVKRYWDV